MKLLFILLLLINASFCIAQNQNIYFYKNNGDTVSVKDSADFIRVVNDRDSISRLYDVTDFYKDGHKKMVGKSLLITPVRLQGLSVRYYPDGQRKAICNYSYGNLSGSQYQYYPNGVLYTRKETARYNTAFPEKYLRDDLILDVNDSTGKPLVKDGLGHCVIYNDDFTKVVEEGEVSEGKRAGIWKGNYADKQITFTENYDKGKLKSGKAITANGTVSEYSGPRLVYPQFPGGINAFLNFLKRAIHFSEKDRKTGVVEVEFWLEQDGGITNVKVIRNLSPVLDDLTLKALQQSPKWFAATEFGLPVRMKYIARVPFMPLR